MSSRDALRDRGKAKVRGASRRGDATRAVKRDARGKKIAREGLIHRGFRRLTTDDDDAQLEAFRVARATRKDAPVVEAEAEEAPPTTDEGVETRAGTGTTTTPTDDALAAAVEDARAARAETANVKSELAVLRLSLKEARASAARAESEKESARDAAKDARDAAGEASGARESLERRAREAEAALADAESARDAAVARLEETERARAETVKKLEAVETLRSKSAADTTSAKELARERDAAVKASEAAMSRIRNLESALRETREELLRAEEEGAQLRRDLDESREERRLGGAAARGGGDEGDDDTRDDGAETTHSTRGQFYTYEEIAAQEEEKYALLAELREERSRRVAVEEELEDLVNTQNDVNARAESASRVAAVAEVEADDYRERMSQIEKSSRDAKKSAEAFEKRALAAESAIADIKSVIDDQDGQRDDELHLRVRAYVARKLKRAEAALSDAVEETQLLRSKAKEMGATRVTDAADVDERVAKLVEGRDKLVEELNEASMELERMDSEIEKREAATAEAREEVANLEARLASSNAQNARLIEIIEEQGKWSTDSAPAAATASASAPVTPVKSMARHVDARKREIAAHLLASDARDRKSLLASIEARLLEIQSM